MAKSAASIDLDDVDVLRARAIAAALKDARPADYLTNHPAREAWYDCCRHVAAVVCSARGISILSFYNLCGSARLMKISIYMEPVFELELTHADVAPLLILCDYHYDSACRQASKPGGFVFGWRNMVGGPERDETVVPTPVACPATRRELDTLLKCCEGVSAAALSKLLTREQEKQVGELCAFVLSALEHSMKVRAKFEPVVINEPTRRGQLLWATAPGRW